MTPFEAIKLGLIKGDIPVPLTFTTTKLAQSWTLRLTAGAVYVFDWGDGQQTWVTGNGADQVTTHTYASAGTYTIKFYTSDPTKVITFNCASNGLIGTLPSFAAYTGLTGFYCYTNSFSGYTAGAQALTCTTWRAETNALSQAAVDAILADFATNVAARPAVGTINLGGGTNSAPSAAGLASRAAILAAKPGWTVAVNP